MFHISTPLDLATILATDNIAKELDGDSLAQIGAHATDGYTRDMQSRAEWETMHAEVLKMALQVPEPKSFPWEGASNVILPLITIASLQFQSRAYPLLVNKPDLVRCEVDTFGMPMLSADKIRERRKLAEAISGHMSRQLLSTPDWETDFDRLLLIVALVGCAFKKVYFDPVEGRNRSLLVLPNDLVVNYFTRDINKAEFVSHRMRGLTDNDVISRIRRGFYVGDEELVTRPQLVIDQLDAVKDKAQGLNPGPGDLKPLDMVEVHCAMDLDGDGYREPYIVTVDVSTQRVYRIVKRFDHDCVEYVDSTTKVAHIRAHSYFQKFWFMPSPDAGFYEMGLGTVLRHPNHIINSLINQLMDAGTLSNMGGGWLARTIKVRAGGYSFRPGEFKRTDSSPADLKDGVLPLPVREPSRVLLELLQFLVEYSERITGATDIMTGIAPGQNTPAETSRNTIEQGLKIFSGVVQRIWLGMTGEFRMMFNLNRRYFEGRPGEPVQAIDYRKATEDMIFPSSDPTVVSDALRIQQATTIWQMAMSPAGGMINKYEALKNLLRALKVRDIESIAPDPTGPNAMPMLPDPKMAVEQLKSQERLQVTREKMKAKYADLMLKAQELPAKIKKLEAEAAKAEAEAKIGGVNAAANLANTQLNFMKHQHQQQMDAMEIIAQLLQETEHASGDTQQGGVGGMVEQPAGGGVPGSPQPGGPAPA